MSLEQLAARRHLEMAHGSGATADWGFQPQARVEFCRSVVTRAQEIAVSMVLNQGWRQIFDDERDSQVRHQLVNESGNSTGPLEDLFGSAQTLIANLQMFQRKNNDGPSLVV